MQDKLYPKQILIESSTRCNLRCKGCLVGTTPPQDMDFVLMEKIIKDNAGRGAIVPYLYGEPLMYPYIYETAKLSVETGARFYIATNGMFWNTDLFELMTDENGCYQIIFSLDSIDQEHQKLCRPGSDAEKIMGHIADFASLRDSKGHNIDIAVKIIDRGQDYAEIEDFVAFWLDKKYIDYVAVGKMLNAKTEKGMRDYDCLYPNGLYICITVDGSVVPCMYNLDAYQSRELGNIKNMTIEEAYNTVMFHDFRWLHPDVPPCDTCGFAYTGSGMDGTMSFQIDNNTLAAKMKMDLGKIFVHTDYYNTFYSRQYKREGAMYE